MGLRLHPVARGIFPLYSAPYADDDPEGLTSDGTWADENGPEQFEIAAEELRKFELKQFVLKFDSYSAVCQHLGEKPVLSQLRVLTKERNGVKKHRIIFDLKASGVTAASSNMERVLLPRVLDVIHEIMLHAQKLPETHCMKLLVVDFTDAFWQIPIARQEQRHFVTKLGSSYYVLLRAAQGSRAGPLLWGRLASF
eukprot:6464345-Amphidinium_carterae.1